MSQIALKFSPELKHREKFLEFHYKNPMVWKEFEKFALKGISVAKRRGLKYISADMIAHRVRWETTIETVGNDFKLNNNFVSHYSQLFQNKHPELSKFFINKKVKP